MDSSPPVGLPAEFPPGPRLTVIVINTRKLNSLVSAKGSAPLYNIDGFLDRFSGLTNLYCLKWTAKL